jgi:hypothetical protein
METHARKSEAMHFNARLKLRPVRQGVSTDSLKFHPGPPCPTLLRPVGGPPLKQFSDCLGGGPPTGQAACGLLLPPWIPHAVRAWLKLCTIL